MKIIQESLTGDGRVLLTGYIQEASLEMPAMAVKPAVLVCPGGAYLFTSDREAEPIALAYVAKGFQAFVLRYSVGGDANGCKPLHEASQAIALMRRNAEVWCLDPEKIATVGFSAGGHLAAWVGLCGENRPNAMILGYPGVSIGRSDGRDGPNVLANALLGGEYTPDQLEGLNLIRYVDAQSVPMFCWHTAEDALIPAASVLRFAAAFAEAGVPFELHVFQRGEHGLALGNYVTANGRKAMCDEAAAAWLDMSVTWFLRNFGEPEIVEKPYVMAEHIREKIIKKG